MAEPTFFNIERRRTALIITPRGDISTLQEHDVLDELRRALDAVADDPPASIIVDLDNAPYFGSSMLGALIKLWRNVAAGPGRMILCNISEAELDILRVTRLDAVWEICPTRDDALASAAVPRS
jgi:anti-sigma B factor antagonist